MIAPARLPPPVQPGDRVGVAALSGPVDPERLRAGLEALAGLGFEPVLADNLTARDDLFAGSDRVRLAAFHRLVDDPSVRAVFFARGGHGVLRLLEHLDWSRLARTPRAYVGYSDLTPFLFEVVRRLELVAFHGPMVAADLARGLGAEEEESLLRALAGDYPAHFRLAGGLAPGSGEGVLLGGCLSLITATLGTPFAPDLAGSVLFWEDVDEPAYRLDRMLTHLRLSGSLARVRGVVIGAVRALDEETGQGPVWQRLLRETALRERWPLATGLHSGHTVPNLTLPIGMRVRLKVSSSSAGLEALHDG